MNKLEVGMYVKTKRRMFQPPQIAKIKSITKDSGYKNQYYIELDHNLIPDYKFHIYQEDILKSSHNIIDLIEVGDYVNGNKVMSKDNHLLWLFDNEEYDTKYIGISNIKSIVTKEMFESMKYEVGDNNE